MRRNKGQSPIQYATVILVIVALVGSWMAYSAAGQGATESQVNEALKDTTTRSDLDEATTGIMDAIRGKEVTETEVAEFLSDMDWSSAKPLLERAGITVPEAGGAKPGEGIRYDFINQAGGTDPVYATLKRGIRDFTDPMGIKLVTRSAAGEKEKLPGWIRAATDAGTDAIILSSWLPKLVNPALEYAMNNGVTVITTIIKGGQKRDSFVGVADLSKLGEMKASALDPYLEKQYEDMGEPVDVLVLNESIGPRTKAYHQAALDHWKNDLGIEVRTKMLEVTNDQSKAQSRATAELSANPDKYEAILGQGGISTAAANLAVQNIDAIVPGDADPSTIKEGEIPIAGMDFLDPTIQGIKQGYTVGVISWQPWECGYLPAAIAYPKIKWDIKPPEEITVGFRMVDNTELGPFLDMVEQNRW